MILSLKYSFRCAFLADCNANHTAQYKRILFYGKDVVCLRLLGKTRQSFGHLAQDKPNLLTQITKFFWDLLSYSISELYNDVVSVTPTSEVRTAIMWLRRVQMPDMKCYEDRIASNGVTCLKKKFKLKPRARNPPPPSNTRERAHNMVTLWSKEWEQRSHLLANITSAGCTTPPSTTRQETRIFPLI